MQRLFDEAIDTSVARDLVHRLALAWLVDRMTAGNLTAALDVVDEPGTRAAARAEFDALKAEERAQLRAAVVHEIDGFAATQSSGYGTPAASSATTPRASTRST